MRLRKTGVAAVLLTGFLMLGSILPAQARDNCEKRIHRAEQNLNKAIRRHGEHSSQARNRRRQLEEAREQCGHRDHKRDHDRR